MENNKNDDKSRYWQELKKFWEIFFPASYKFDNYKEIDLQNHEYNFDTITEYILNQNFNSLCVPFYNNFEIVGNIYLLFPEFSENSMKKHENLTGLVYNKNNNEKIAETLLKPIEIIYQNVFSSNPQIDESYWINKDTFTNLYQEKQKINKKYFYTTFFRWNINETPISCSLFYAILMDYKLLDYLKSKDDKLKKGGISNFIKLTYRENY